MMLKTARKVPKTGLMLVGLGGNNGCTTVAGILANQKKLSWRTKDGEVHANYFGSLTQARARAARPCTVVHVSHGVLAGIDSAPRCRSIGRRCVCPIQ